jgi:DNA replication protein DnaC
MLREPTIEKLQAMRLPAMAAAWDEQTKSVAAADLSFDERFAMLVDDEWLARENKRLKRSLKEAKLRISHACIEDIEYNARRELDKATVRQLTICRWVTEHQPILITGKTGTGKSYLACALANQACRKGFRACYRRAPRLYDELQLARADGSYARLLARFAKADVLIIDDFAIASITDTARRDLLEVLEDRHGLRATIITSQLDPKLWYDYLADPTTADAICDRIIHGSHRIVLKGPSRRKVRGESDQSEVVVPVSD